VTPTASFYRFCASGTQPSRLHKLRRRSSMRSRFLPETSKGSPNSARRLRNVDPGCPDATVFLNASVVDPSTNGVPPSALDGSLIDLGRQLDQRAVRGVSGQLIKLVRRPGSAGHRLGTSADVRRRAQPGGSAERPIAEWRWRG